MSIFRESDTFEQAKKASYEEFEGHPGASLITGTLYMQGDRQMVSTALSMRQLINVAIADSAGKENDPDNSRNRMIDWDHVKTIKKYLVSEEKYILPPVALNIHTEADVLPIFFATKQKKKMAQVQMLLPLGVKFYIADGQHRIEAIKQAILERPSLGDDALNVNIVLTDSIDQVHQDFVDCAKTKPISLSLLGVYDTRNPISALVRQLTSNVDLFKGRIDKISPKSVGKRSHDLFTLNQIQFSIVEFMLATAAAQDARTRAQIAGILSVPEENKRYLDTLTCFYNDFAKYNIAWREIASRPRGEVATPEMRNQYLCLTATGLRIISRIGHYISMQPVEEREEYVRLLAELDWRVDAQLWRGNVVSVVPIPNSNEGKTIIDTNPAHLKPTIELLRKTIGLEKQGVIEGT